jgi:hypothetical protein
MRIHLNPKQDNLCEELARTAQSLPGRRLTTKTAVRSHRKSWGLREGFARGFGPDARSVLENQSARHFSAFLLDTIFNTGYRTTAFSCL